MLERIETLVLRDDIDGVALLTVNRPQAHNAMNQDVIKVIHALLDDLESDDSVNVIVFTGAGEQSFVAGADINELVARTPVDAIKAVMQNLYERISKFSKPTIAAVNGFAFGGGSELAMACDIRIGSTNAQFALPETGLGIIPSAGGTQRLARIVGIGRATDMILSGRNLAARDALHAGLITELVEPEELIGAAFKLAGRIGSRGPLATKLARLVISRGFDVDHETGMLLEQLAQALAYSSPEKHEGTSAFVEKRRPDFSRVHHERSAAPASITK
ncbi:enoyl-CoA hydratase/isomerase family protein [Glutamicibacter sp. NPDC127525]|uniref:enoyl-CoA hydratase/isomerase family protein n=1 Tax=unclassified Glutamicibacter TaxID=2627139 RepID=UPI0036456A42